MQNKLQNQQWSFLQSEEVLFSRNNQQDATL